MFSTFQGLGGGGGVADTIILGLNVELINNRFPKMKKGGGNTISHTIAAIYYFFYNLFKSL